MTIFEKKSRIIDVSDVKWAHPEARFTWVPAFEGDPYAYCEDESLTLEQKIAIEQEHTFTPPDWLVDNGFCDIVEHEVPGCPEEPDTPARAIVCTPKNLGVAKAKTLFDIPGGGLYQCVANNAEATGFSQRFDCVVVIPIYRTSLRGKYPAAINDCHAVYKWMADNAETLHIDVDNIVLTGMSTGGHLSCALPFRLMKYGYSPRGVVASMPAVDDRGFMDSSRFFPGLSNYEGVYKSAKRWLGGDFALSILGPEAYANRATVEECIGYPPLYLHTAEFDIDRDNSLMFISKVLSAQSFVEVHLWGGLSHMIVNTSGEPCPTLDRIDETLRANIETCFKYDLRRPWVYEEA